jgi:Ca2+-binding EF-hand superfamily protein
MFHLMFWPLSTFIVRGASLPDMSSATSGATAGQRELSSPSQASAHSISKTKYDIANHLTENELREFREIFSLVDTVRLDPIRTSRAAKFRTFALLQDGGGTISATELSDLMETLGIRASDVRELDSSSV